MESIYHLIKKHAEGKGEDMMWKSTEIISDAIDRSMPEVAKKHLMDELYGLMTGGHYDKEMAHECVEKMYYEDESGEEHYGPFISEKDSKAMYEKMQTKIPDYNEFDFFVCVNMIASDMRDFIMKYFPSDTAEDRRDKYGEIACAWLADKDWPTTDKIWAYFHK